MKLNKSTRYALYATMEMALAGSGEAVPAARVARRYRISETVLAKVFQQLAGAGIATGTRGVGGGYRLVRSPSELTVLDVIEVFEPVREPRQCLLYDEAGECVDTRTCRLRLLFDEVDELVRATFASTTLETLISGQGARAQWTTIGEHFS